MASSCRTEPPVSDQSSDRAGAARRRAPEFRPRTRIPPEREHHRRLSRPAVTTIHPGVQTTAVEQIPEGPLDLAAPLVRALTNVGRPVHQLDLVESVLVGLGSPRHREVDGCSRVESVQVLEASPHPTSLLVDQWWARPAWLPSN